MWRRVNDYRRVSEVEERTAPWLSLPSLPPGSPLHWTPDLLGVCEKAHLALGELEAVQSLLSGTKAYGYLQLCLEAALPSGIEAPPCSLSEVLAFRLGRVPPSASDHLRDAAAHAAGMQPVLMPPECIRMPQPSLELLAEVHAEATAGRAYAIPPLTWKTVEPLARLDLFLKSAAGSPTPALPKAALAYAHLMLMEPIASGTCRLGRILAALIFRSCQLHSLPILPLGKIFSRHGRHFLKALGSIRERHKWDDWLLFFGKCVADAANLAAKTLRDLHALAEKDRRTLAGLGRGADSLLAVYEALLTCPVTTSGWLVETTDLAPATVNKSLAQLAHLGMVSETTGQRRHRFFEHSGYLAIVSRM